MARIFYLLLWVFTIYVTIFIGHYTPTWFAKPERTLDFFCWGDTLDQELIKAFEKEYNIRIRIHPFSSNEEMIVKLKAVNGEGYDLVCASDYAVRILKEEGLLSPLNHESLTNSKAISPHLLSLDFDPTNEVSLPIEWEPYVFVTKNNEQLPLKALFEPKAGVRLVMPADPIEAITFAAYTLYGKKEVLTDEELLKVNRLLKAQKKSVEAYADHRARYLIETDNCDMALIRASFARLIERDKGQLHYALPTDWHFVNIENLAITKSSQKKEDAHKLIDFMLSYEAQKRQSERMLSFSVRKDLKSDTAIEDEVLDRKDPQFFHYLSKEEDVRDLWVSLKSN